MSIRTKLNEQKPFIPVVASLARSRARAAVTVRRAEGERRARSSPSCRASTWTRCPSGSSSSTCATRARTRRGAWKRCASDGGRSTDARPPPPRPRPSVVVLAAPSSRRSPLPRPPSSLSVRPRARIAGGLPEAREESARVRRAREQLVARIHLVASRDPEPRSRPERGAIDGDAEAEGARVSNHAREGLLRALRRRARGVRVGDQERVPKARAQAPSGQEHRAGGGGRVQEGEQGLGHLERPE